MADSPKSNPPTMSRQQQEAHSLPSVFINQTYVISQVGENFKLIFAEGWGLGPGENIQFWRASVTMPRKSLENLQLLIDKILSSSPIQ